MANPDDGTFLGKGNFGDGEGLLTSVVLVGETPTVAVSFQPTRVVGKNRWDFLRRKEFLVLMVQKSG